MATLWRPIMLRAKQRRPSAPRSTRLTVEVLEDRNLLSGNVLQSNLVSDLPNVADHLDPALVNPWGISESATSPFWVSDNGSGLSTLYDSHGVAQPPGTTPPVKPLQVTIPAGMADP